MKKIILLFLAFNIQTLQSQTYILDTTFGDSGTIVIPNLSVGSKGMLINDYYYFASGTNVVRFNYDGSLDTTFGTNGMRTINVGTDTHYFTNFKVSNNYLYGYGYISASNGINNDGFIYKMDLNGNMDTTFGANGYSRINFGQIETITDFCLDQNNNLFFIGSKRPTTPPSSGTSGNKILLFKISANGLPDTTFDPVGFKEYQAQNETYGVSINPYNGSYLIAAKTQTYVPVTGGNHTANNIGLCRVDTNGILDITYGTNGFKLIEVSEGMGTIGGTSLGVTLRDSQLVGDDLYACYSYAWSASQSGNRLLRYNLTTDFKHFDVYTIDNSFSMVDNSGIFTTGSTYCYPSCNSDFKLRKLQHNGTLDDSFHINGNYTYSFPTTSGGGTSIDNSKCFVKDSDGKIMIAGSVNRIPSTLPSGFAMLRLVEGTLNTNEIQSTAKSFYPNPFSNQINLALTEPISEINLFDSSGRKLKNPSFDYNNNLLQINFSNDLGKGIYILRVHTTNNKDIVEKIIKE